MRIDNLLKNEIPIVTLITALCYGIAYLFQWGYSSYFGYPTEFIYIDINTMLKTLFWLLGFGVIAATLLTGQYIALKNGRRLVALAVGFLILIFAYLIVFGFENPLKLLDSDSTITLGEISNIAYLPINLAITVNAYLQTRMYLVEAEEQGGDNEHILSMRKRELWSRSILLVLTVFTSAIFFYSAGKIAAYKSTRIYESDTNPSAFLLNVYNNKFVTGRCSKNGVSFNYSEDSTKYTYVRVSDAKRIQEIKKCFEMQRVKY
ncbi:MULTISPECIES: hypothetical protein [Serratia]|uniref:Uncharacterized protein n=1 Tax=Serratia quinivorans TaxID=137545 RepID=A0ABV3UB48_9GAMM|nr:hypothetical protein [Serratia sp. S4]